MSPLGLTSLTVIIALVGGLYYLLVIAKRTKVWLLRPRDMRGLEINVKPGGETSKGLICEKKGGIPRRFFKVGRGYTFPFGPRFLGVEGTAYTGEVHVMQPVKRTTKRLNPDTQQEEEVIEEITEETIKTKLSISDALHVIWGDAEYRKMPQNLRDAVEKSQVGITVEAEPVDEEALDLKPLTEDQIKQEQRLGVLKDIANAVKESDKPNLIWIGLGVALGFAVCLLAVNMNWIPIR